MLIVYGIETTYRSTPRIFRLESVATALIACGMRRRVSAEEQSDNEVRTSLVHDQREGKRKVMINKIVLTVYGIETYQCMC